MQGANGSVFGCGLCRRTKGIGIWKLPVAKDESHGKWRDEWLGKIKKTREMDQNFSEQSKSDAIYTCEKQLRLKISKYVSIHVCTLVFVKLSDLLWTGLSLPFLLTTGCGISGDNIKEMPSSSYISTSMGIIQKGLGSYILFWFDTIRLC